MPQSSKGHSLLQFAGYEVTALSFSLRPENTDLEEDAKVSYAPKFERSISKLDDHRYDLLLSVSVGGESSQLPFSAKVELLGHFRLQEIPNPDEAMRVNATAILFPYLRATLSQLTTLANISALTLPTFNIVEMFEAKRLQSKKSEKTIHTEKIE